MFIEVLGDFGKNTFPAFPNIPDVRSALLLLQKIERVREGTKKLFVFAIVDFHSTVFAPQSLHGLAITRTPSDFLVLLFELADLRLYLAYRPQL